LFNGQENVSIASSSVDTSCLTRQTHVYIQTVVCGKVSP